ncbi:MAG: hypothetical protein ABIY71_07750 [Flavobacteriales bacterium]
MRRPLSRTVASCLLLLAISISACRKDKAQPQWDLDILAPLVTTSLTIGDLVPDSILSTDGQGNVSILYTAELFSISLDTVLTAPDTSFRYGYALPFPGPVQFQPGATFNTNDDVTRFDLDDLQLTKLIVRSGQLDVAITSMMNGHIIGNFSLPGASLNGSPFVVQQLLPPGTPATPSAVHTSRPLDGYVFDMRGPDHDAVNTLATHISYSNSPDGSIISITNQDSLLALVSYFNIVPQYATGSFGTRTITVDPATTDLDLFQNISGILDLDQVTAQLRIRNGIGVDARANIHYIRSQNTFSGNDVDLIGSITSGPVNIDRAIDLGSNFQSALNTFNLNQGNSNIDLFLENLPDRIGYSMDIMINPLGNISNGHDFLYYDSKLTAEMEVDVPLRLIATDLTLRKTVTLDLPGSADAHAWKSGVLHLFAENGFPFSAAIELSVVDQNGQVLTILAPGGTVSSGALGADGFVSTSTSSRVDVELNPAQMTLLQQTGKLLITAAFNTADQSQHVQILDRYRMDLQLTVDANYTVNGDD